MKVELTLNTGAFYKMSYSRIGKDSLNEKSLKNQK